MPNLTLITTLYTLDPVLVCITRLSPSRVIVITEDGAVDKKAQAERILETTFGKVIEIQKLITSLYDPVMVAQDVADIIEQEHDMGNQVILNVSGGRKPQAFGSLFGAYARSEMVKKVVYVKEEDNAMIEFPILGFNISPTKKAILEHIKQGEKAVSKIAVKVDISRGMAYNHIRELKEMGYISDEDGFDITDSGRLAVI
ncbi:CRISPR-associated protein Csa3 [Methanolobus vulcani]|jgi:CRISPR-associated protein Csa3|uniref:CRISPR-associated protein Csa3 n=1 Tax=Methanolobus vulcani TaxID=38026 RepID=A0A7Z7FBR8_9EURY|nr:CRISPR-associated CARF protein Csa3 [Methanolobus vulcani]MDK2826271.1 CRISPR-associated protein Csa3 [Methanolobus sp.]MDK2948424.1 CRISPR-associated protein Csa3 [Methanolobus sp.]SDF31220.1 CRISPR-associated protein Csa3 [Methanolobus vulcani]